MADRVNKNLVSHIMSHYKKITSLRGTSIRHRPGYTSGLADIREPVYKRKKKKKLSKKSKEFVK